DLGQKIDHIFGTAVELGMPLLATETLDFRDSQAVDADFGQRLAHFVQLERFDDGGNLLHGLLQEIARKEYLPSFYSLPNCESRIPESNAVPSGETVSSP